MRAYVKHKQKYKQKAPVNKLRGGLGQGEQWKGNSGNDSEHSGWANWVDGSSLCRPSKQDQLVLGCGKVVLQFFA